MSASAHARLASSQKSVLSPADVEHLLGDAVALASAGRAGDALAAMSAVAPASIGPIASTIVGLIALTSGDGVAALFWLDAALALDPGSIEALKGRATALATTGRAAEAEAAFRDAFAAGCADPVAHFNHGNILRALGRSGAAIDAFDQALRLRPDYPEALHAGGTILRDGGRPAEALRFFDEALRLQPAFLDAILDRANLLDRLDRAPEALQALDRGLALHPGNAALLNNKGVVLFHLGRLDEAIAVLDTAAATDGQLAAAPLNKAEVLIRQGAFDAALACLDVALRLNPDYLDAHIARGIALKLSCDLAAARAAFERALTLEPASAYARTNMGELKLLEGDFESGWVDYDARFLTRGHARPVLGWPVPEWRGERNPGRVVVFADQAAGDVIHFARYIPLLREAGADVTLVCRPRMQRLLRHVSQGCRVIGGMPERQPFDFQVPLSNMPYACRTLEATIPRAPYIMAEPDLVADWHARLGAGGLKVGLCWRGSQDFRSDPKRSVPLTALRPLAAIPGVRLISLQMVENLGPDAASLDDMGIDLPGELDRGPDGFVETAALMAALDLVVSCDTSIAHLAGALGRPTFVLLQKVPEWRFLMGREDCPWYPTMRLFRQVRQDVWDEPVARLAAALAALAPSRGR